MSNPLEAVRAIPAGANRREYLWDNTLRFVFDRLAATSNGLTCWAEVHWIGRIPEPQVLAHGRFDLMSSRTVPGLTRQCEANHQADRLPFSQLLTGLSLDVIRDFLEVDPPVELSTMPESPAWKWLLPPLIGGSGATSIIGPGGSGKSLLAMAAGLSVATGRTGFLGLKPLRHGPVVYIDWEATASDQAERMRALCRGAEVPVPPEGALLYLAGRGSLAQSAKGWDRCLRQAGAVMAIIDSVMLARAGDAFGPTDTTALFEALRSFEIPVLLVDHKSREAMRKKWTGAYGSVVNDNSIRLSWEVTADVALLGGASQLRFANVKHNNVRRQDDIAFEFQPTSDSGDILTSLVIKRLAPTAMAVLPEGDASAAERIVMTLDRAGGLGATVRELADDLDISESSVRGRTSQLRREGKIRKRGDRWFGSTDSQELVDADPF